MPIVSSLGTVLLADIMQSTTDMDMEYGKEKGKI